MAADPGRFLSAVQIGITLVGVLAGAFSGATLGARLAAWLRESGLSATVADPLGVGAVVVAITYLSLIIGELVPKQIALRDPEGVAARVAPAMKLVAGIAGPVGLGARRLGRDGPPAPRSGRCARNPRQRGGGAQHDGGGRNGGVLKSREHDMLEGVMRLADRSARALMTPRVDVEVLDLAAGTRR